MADTHDQNFKNLILDYPRQALELFAPEEAAHFGDDVVFTPIREEQLKDRLSDRFLELDVPLLCEWPDGRREALLFVVEQHTRPTTFSINKLARYCLELADLFQTHRVVPVAIFLKRSKRLPTELRLRNEYFEYLHFRYLRCILPELPAEDYLDSSNLVARLNLPNMHYPKPQKIHIYAQAQEGLFTLEPDDNRKAKYLDFIDIYSRLTENERREYEQTYPDRRKTMIGLVARSNEKARQEGILLGMEQGREQGLEQGLLAGERQVLQRLLVRRFGPLPKQLQQRLDDATAEQLEVWTEKLLDAGTLDEVFGD